MHINPAQSRIIQITEYETKSFQHDEISDLAGIELYEKYKIQVDVEFPNYKTRNKWQLKAKGWVGYIPLNSGFALKINPKVPIQNLLGMLEYAYNLKSFSFLEGLINCESIEDFYNRLAYILAQKIIERCRKGLYRAYVPKIEQLAYARGRINLQQIIQKPWNVKLKCEYEEHTADIIENQILFWTLFNIGHSRFCSEKVSLIVRQAYHAMQGMVTLQLCNSADCIHRQYNRLNEDYRILHYLCRFFLENIGPSNERGNHKILPFLVEMARLYEMFVTEWLKENTPQGYFFKQQHLMQIGQNRQFSIDLLLCDAATGKTLAVLDTKYKTPEKAASSDIHQMISYANTTQCKQAFLIYPKDLTQPLNIKSDNIQVRSLTFSLENNLNHAGQTFLKNLLPPS
ncbi:McrBC 5-methylcytosine restriction system component [Cylindrospermum stagnale PCC 7417]|uniref:McrBC 5-methylcytosine restriction system component n=1 Tax=Cylindrospermum stagnale PCC 7417 TaxID=56107 RepID=K9WY00_9NOST|nr:McrBC 5-methylcytosine restriction system component [Cylindrospermum stagnale]AFZ24397.1 McrBC 5-methylcytosine restriction system component [Cylindrospermum stagnale PCC 7417]